MLFRSTEDEDNDDIPDEIARLLEQEEKTIRPHQEEIELINLVLRITKERSKSVLHWRKGSRKGSSNFSANTRTFLHGRMKTCQVWILRLWSIGYRLNQTVLPSDKS